jgi:hypothetical protein
MADDALALPDAIRAFEASRVDPDVFDHAAHVRLAWLYLRHCDVPETLQRYSAGLQRLTAKLGVPDKYHATVTGFLLLEIAERRSVRPDADWQGFVESNPDLFTDVRRLLLERYDETRLDSPLARRQFLLPDRPRGKTASAATAGTLPRAGRQELQRAR